MIYLDNAATTFPKPPEVYENTLRFMRECGGNPGRGSHYFSTASAEMIETTRREVARFFQIPDHRRVIFTYNCTDSINIVLKGLLKRGDHVLTTNLDHNSVSRPLEHLSRTLEVALSRVPFDSNGQIDPERVRRSITHSTKLIILNHGSNVLGSVQPLGPFVELAQEKGLLLLLDAAQSAGRIPLQLQEAPVFLVCSGHKALYGMPGVGILTVPGGIALSKWREGGSGTTSESLDHPDEYPMRLEAGTPNYLAIASIREGLGFIKREGMQAIHKRELEMAGRLVTSLVSDERFVIYSAPAEEDQLPVISFNIHNAPPEEVATILDQNFGIAVRSGLHCAAVLHAQLGTSPGGCLRVSPGYFNKPEDIDTLVQALMEIATGYSGQPQ